jgi:molybdopterin molybdotransferase
MLTVADARALILDRISPVDVEDVDVVSAGERVLARDEKAQRAVPAFTNSAMDGVGVRAEDVAGASAEAPVTLRVVGSSLPGGAPALTAGRALEPGECVRIMTGAPLPPGVDAIVMRELTDESQVAQGSVRVLEAVRAGMHVRARGEDLDEGALVSRAGDVVTPARMNALLAAGVVRVTVHRKPVVCVLASGDELREIGHEDIGSKELVVPVVPNSNAHAIAALLRLAGCEVRALGIAPDTLEGHVDAMRKALDADALVTIGGVSMGTHDFVKPALEQIGGTLEMWKVAMRPGKPIAFGRVSRETRTSLAVFGLPGNPVSAHVAAELFLRPALERLRGARALVRPLWRATLSADGPAFTKKAGLEHYARASVTFQGGALEEGALVVRLLDKQGSHHISALAASNALACFGIDVERVEPGAPVDVMLLESPASLRTR